MIGDDLKDQIKERCDIVELIRQYVPSLKNAGANFKGLCPFHKEKTPSFHVFPETQHFYCFGCRAAGDAFSFVMEHEGFDFPGALRFLGEHVGIDVDAYRKEQAASGGSQGRGSRAAAYAAAGQQSVRKDELYTLHEKLAAWYEQELRSERGAVALDYCRQRGLQEELIQRFRIGYAPNSFDEVKNWGKTQGYSYEQMLVGGVLSRRSEADDPTRAYDRWRHRIMFPIMNPQGRIIGFSGRVLEADQGGGKYINSPETPIFHKSAVLYGLSQARDGIREKGYIVLCEGQMDSIACHAAGLNNAVAPQGTAFTESQAQLIKRFTENVVICFDSDDAGVNAALKSINALVATELNAKIAMLPQGQDPDSILSSKGADALLGYINQARDFVDFIIDYHMHQNDASPVGKTRVVRAVLEVIAKLKSPVIRSEYCNHTAQRLGIALPPVFQELTRVINRERRQNQFRDRRAEEPPPEFNDAPLLPDGSQAAAPVVEAEAHLLDLCLCHESYANRLDQELDSSTISQSPVGRALNDVLAYTSQGEWSLARQTIIDNIASYDSPAVIRVLNSPEYGPETEEQRLDECYDGCLRTVLRTHYQQLIAAKEIEYRNVSDPQAKRQIFSELDKLDRQLRKFM